MKKKKSKTNKLKKKQQQKKNNNKTRTPKMKQTKQNKTPLYITIFTLYYREYLLGYLTEWRREPT